MSKATIGKNTIAGIILAAGSSSRLGTPKQLVRLGAETLLERTVRVALEAGLTPVYGVVPENLSIEPIPAGMIPVVNQEAAEGMASSIRFGVRALANHNVAVSGAIIMACDQPAVTAGHLRELIGNKDCVVASAYSARKGVPAYFPSNVFETLLTLTGDFGARELLQDAMAIPLPLGELDVDTIEDLREARNRYLK